MKSRPLKNLSDPAQAALGGVTTIAEQSAPTKYVLVNLIGHFISETSPW